MMKKLFLTVICAWAFLNVNAQTFTVTSNGFDAVKSNLHTRIVVYADNIVRVFKSDDGDLTKKRSIPVLMQPATSGFSVNGDTTAVTLTTSKLTVTYTFSNGQVAVSRADGTALLKEKPFGTSMTATTDGTQASYTLKQTFTLDTSEDIFGLGQIQDGCLSQRKKSTYLEQGNTRVCIPYFCSTKGYGLYWDNYSPTTFNDNGRTCYFESTGTEIDYYVLAGQNNAEVLAGVRKLTGECPMPALWNFGLYQSKERYESAPEVRKVVAKYRSLKVPLDCIVQDWQYWGTDNRQWNAMDLLNVKYKSSWQAMMDTVHNNHAKLMISIWANFGTATAPYQELSSLGRLIPVETYPAGYGVHPYDCYDSIARNVYWKYLYNGLVAKGIDAYWMDSTEPDYVAASSSELDYMSGFGKTWRSLRNAFPYCTTRGVYDHHRDIDGIAGSLTDNAVQQKRVSIMTRSGFIGQQHYGVNTWSGDVTSSWTTLANQIPAALNFSACGIPYWNSDTGGFFVGTYSTGINDAAWRRLYMRWTQFSTFCPLMRFHGTNTPREIYQFGTEGDEKGDFDQILKYIKIRYRMLPYLYSTAWEISSNDKTFMNALALAYEGDSNARTVKDEYMFGGSFLVAPVLKDSATSRSVYLPQGTKWYNFWTGDTSDAGTVTFQGTVDQLPLYIPAGTILPWGPDVQYSTEKKWDNLEIRVYPGADGSFTLYEDECDNYNYEQGKRTIIPFRWDDATHMLTIGARQGSFDGMLQTRTFNIIGINKDHNPADSHATTFHATVAYDGSEVSVQINPDDVPSGIRSISAATVTTSGRMYKINGERATDASKGIIIGNGNKKIVR